MCRTAVAIPPSSPDLVTLQGRRKLMWSVEMGTQIAQRLKLHHYLLVAQLSQRFAKILVTQLSQRFAKILPVNDVRLIIMHHWFPIKRKGM